MHACIYQHLFLLHFMYFFPHSATYHFSCSRDSLQVPQFLLPINNPCWSMYTMFTCIHCGINVMCYRQNCAAHLCLSFSLLFPFPFQCGLRRNTLVSSASLKTINMAVGIKNCVSFCKQYAANPFCQCFSFQ